MIGTKPFGLAVAMAGLMIGASGRASAAFQYDQQNTTNQTFTVTALPGLGQTFTPATSSIDFATFILSNTNLSTYKVQLYSGIGYDGTLLGESSTQALAVAPFPAMGQSFTVDNAQPVEFDFAAPITLNPGSVYTLRLAQVTGAGGYFFSRSATTDPYSGGSAYDVAPISGVDLVFGEGIRAAIAVPEPSSLILCGVAALSGLGLAAARRRMA